MPGMLQLLGGRQDLEVTIPRLPSLSCLTGAMSFKVSHSFREGIEKDLRRKEMKVCDAGSHYQKLRGSDVQAASLSSLAQRHLQNLDSSSRPCTPVIRPSTSPASSETRSKHQRQLDMVEKMRRLEQLLDPLARQAAVNCSSGDSSSAGATMGSESSTVRGTPISPTRATSTGAQILILPESSCSPTLSRHRLSSLSSPRGGALQPTSNSSSRPGTAMLPVTDYAFGEGRGLSSRDRQRCSYSHEPNSRGGSSRQRLGTGVLAASWSGPISDLAREFSGTAFQSTRHSVDTAGHFDEAGLMAGERAVREGESPGRSPRELGDSLHTTEAFAIASEGNLRCVSRGSSVGPPSAVPGRMRSSGRGSSAPASVSGGDGTLNPGLIHTWRKNLPNGPNAFKVTRGLVYSVFAEMDFDGTGILTYSGFETAALNIGLREEQARKLFKSLDQRDCGYISVREWGSPLIEKQILEFTRLYLVNTRGVNGKAPGVKEVKSVQLAIQLAMAKMNLRGTSRISSTERLIEAFAFIDRDKSGTLDKREMEDAFAALGVYVTQEVLERMMAYFDKDKNGTIDYNEFIVTLFPVYSKSYKPVS